MLPDNANKLEVDKKHLFINMKFKPVPKDHEHIVKRSFRVTLLQQLTKMQLFLRIIEFETRHQIMFMNRGKHVLNKRYVDFMILIRHNYTYSFVCLALTG